MRTHLVGDILEEVLMFHDDVPLHAAIAELTVGFDEEVLDDTRQVATGIDGKHVIGVADL